MSGEPEVVAGVVERLGKLSPERLALLQAMLRRAPAAGDSPVLSRLYDGLAEARAARPEPDREPGPLLTYAPFAEVVPGFSWAAFFLSPGTNPEHARLARRAQLEMREVLFRHVDFASCQRVLDLGCGYATDLIALAEAYRHLTADGYTLSGTQARLARDAVAARGLDGRVHVYHRDSVSDPFPGHYDLVLGLEVVHHVAEKDRLFAHVGRHLRDGGLVVLADFVSHVLPGIEDREGASVFVTREHWAAILARAGLEVADCVDASPEIANFLRDDDVDASLAALDSVRIDETVRAAFRSYRRGGDLLARGLASYVLLTIRKRSAPRELLYRGTRDVLGSPKAYGALFPRRWRYRPEWRPAPRPEAPAGPAPAGSDRRSAAPDWPAYAELLPRLEGLAADYAAAALGPLEPGIVLDGDRIAERLGVVPRHRRLLARLLEIVAEDGRMRRRDGGWEARATPPPDRGRHVADLRARYPFAEAELALVERCGSRLGAVLRGEADGPEVLFPGGDLALAARLYRDAVPFRMANRLAGEVLAGLPGGPRPEPLRVLEIGAGTGATTAAVLSALGARPVEYVFTDVSGRFTREARETFGGHPFVEYALLDIERAPAAQGFEARRFDAVVAANVLHATADLGRTLRHARELLAPGGTLVLVEITRRQRWLDVCFGLLDGWWAFADHARRPDHPLLPATEWRAALEENGFERVRATPVGPAGADGSGLSVIVAARGGAHPLAGARRWIVFGDAAGTGRALAARLEADGDRCTLVSPGEAFRRVSERELRVDPARREDMDRVLGASGPDPGPPLAGIVYLWSLDAGSESGTLDVPAAAGLVGERVLRLVQALAERPPADLAPLWLVTRGAAPAGPVGGAPGLAQSPAWGLAAVVDWEHPELRCVRVDLSPHAGDAASEVEALLAELRSPIVEDRIALRGAARYVERLCREPAPPAEPASGRRVRPDRAYLVTGGFGGLGLLVAGWLAEAGARHLALVGRRPPGPAAAARIAELEAAGVRVLAAQADVADAGSLRSALAAVARALPPLAGVVHAAGTLDDGVLARLDAERVRRVMAPKVDGAWLLSELTRDATLDFFLLFSSVASVLGSPGQANHAAACAFQDALAHERRARGLPAASINWGAWAEVGAAARGGAGERFQARGIDPIAPRAGLAVLSDLLAAGAAQTPQTMVAPVTWETFLSEHPAGRRSPFYDELALEARRPGPPDAPAPAGPGPDSWADAPPAERPARLVRVLRRLAARAIGADPAQVGADVPPSRLGLDSLMAVEMRHALRRELAIDVSIAALMQAESLGRLAEEIAGRERAAPAPDGPDLVEGEL